MADDKTKIPNDIAKLNFEAALAELEEIVGKLESGGVELDVSIKIYERGEQLKAHCESLLKTAQGKIEKITLSGDGEATGTQPLDVE